MMYNGTRASILGKFDLFIHHYVLAVDFGKLLALPQPTAGFGCLKGK
jgi:hypothetical protein